jgi:hypothetical protein
MGDREGHIIGRHGGGTSVRISDGRVNAEGDDGAVALPTTMSTSLISSAKVAVQENSTSMIDKGIVDKAFNVVDK